jgi:hypothetical protein
MKKLTVLALLATVVVATPMFAVQRNLVVAPNATFANALGPASTNNGDSCDIGVTPAATLLLPYFAVETSGAAGSGPTTLFTITNTSRFPQIAHVTVWTDWSAPVLDFNLYLTGYDVQSINLYDIIVRGIIAPPSGATYTATAGTASNSAVGSTPLAGTLNPNFTATARTNCSNIPGTRPGGQGGAVQAAVQAALTTGSTSALCGGAQIGANHGTLAVGYVTVDVSADCTNYLPTNPTYYTAADGILYDNVLIGDFEQIGPSPAGSSGGGFDASGNPMVHIRAVPEGGNAGVIVGTNLPFTFYNRYSNLGFGTSGTDRRQPLPSQWAARWVGGSTTSGGVTVSYNTNYKIWREGITGANVNCPSATANASITSNSALAVTAVVRFDEHENSFGFGTSQICSPFCTAGGIPPLPETSSTAVGTANNAGIAGTYPSIPSAGLASGDLGGWTYLNLTSQGIGAQTSTGTGGVTASPNSLTAAVNFGNTAASPRTTTQNWVVVSMFGNLGTQRLAVDFDAAWLGNGCTPAPAAGTVIGPATQVNGTSSNLVCPTVSVCTPVVTGSGTYRVGPNPNP